MGTALTAAGAAADTGPARPTIVVRVTNLADVAKTVLERAAEDASAIFDLAGVSVVWTLEPNSEPFPDVTTVRVVLHSGMRARQLSTEVKADKTTLGFTPCAGALLQCTIAYIFYDRIAGVARISGVPAGRVLGLTIAHEIGHMLLPRYSHSAHGIMRPSLDLQRAVLPQFTANQAHLVRTRLTAAR